MKFNSLKKKNVGAWDTSYFFSYMEAFTISHLCICTMYIMYAVHYMRGNNFNGTYIHDSDKW